MSPTSPDPVIDHVRTIAEAHGIELSKIVVYGSRARGDHTGESDIDLVLVSPDFEGVEFHARATDFYWEWGPDLPSPDLIPVTPDEFAERAANPTDIVHEAVETGVSVTSPHA